MAEAVIKAGVCGFKTIVKAERSGRKNVVLEIESECPAFKDLNESLKEIDSMEAIMSKVGEGKIYQACQVTCKHSACPVPMGITKAVEVAAGLALPRDVSVILTK